MDKRIIVFIGPPFAGKDTQTGLLAEKMSMPVFSMGALIREAYGKGDPKAIEGFENYSMKGLHLPASLKFHLLREKLDLLEGGYILDNFPANKEDLDVFMKYLRDKDREIDKVFYLKIDESEMERRLTERGRKDDNIEVVRKRRRLQDADREYLVNRFRELSLLEEIDGGRSIDDVQREIAKKLEI
ncbi:MAG: hypothetical protein A2186_00820 [Candidatus Levybacteria bacterium RIFOXYA1_FULL_41_10]|nr:MAG: Adenylate kinase [Candidatus Levybacteria bacterium GW2011_GWA1_39_34]KKR50647.1 MAG: Adenylate kinase [Candidatus Levybacteria bacterium GW2011_GWC1_40_19]KKR72613.1 MAG: Adenylate kinase [Candidatus Levybacteria bacterium GW2011_GWC2_40_7]KKR95332.1 MAG: Adenylate kinase [Candidatus Levybacteria bacterium GW2011_GWA2_41_15]KKS01859.1 MAG: Adenylate kinase [Candidatus Levybacteria bacterium GW2011_GWB1_41_21]OGH20236.1 MAG: hypothetical protein A2695_02055 [Candidatus Levybacteria bac